MDTSLFVMQDVTGEFQVRRGSPRNFQIIFQGIGKISYGENGEPPNKTLISGVPVDLNTFMLTFMMERSNGTLEWKES